jgi:hypothetical protein
VIVNRLASLSLTVPSAEDVRRPLPPKEGRRGFREDVCGNPSMAAKAAGSEVDPSSKTTEAANQATL